MKDKYYITTAIAYTSARPHIGNSYEIVLSDAIARYKRLVGFDVYFQTGTDEHGEKIQNKALENNLTPKEYVDKMAKQIKDNWDILNTSYDKFVRTTDPIHEEKVQKIFQKFYDQGDIYKSEYSGSYCTPCESFWTVSQLVDGNCPDCGRSVSEKSEEAYFFKLSNYTDKLIKHIEDNPNFIEPESRKNEIMNNFLKPGLQDLCVTRSSFDWGIKVPFDTNHVIYVWIDALSNYITLLGYDSDGNSSEEFNKYWPCDIHIIGKDILRFHTIYWPIMLMALGLELPKKIFGHPWLLFGNDKMSKSKGNIVYAEDLIEKYGVDAVRYYMLHEIPFSSDGTFTEELLIERINSDLANVLGNLVNRTVSMINKYFNGEITNKGDNEEVDNDLINKVLSLSKKVDERIETLHVGDALEEIIEVFRRCNKYIDETTPWVLAKDESKKDRLETVLYNLIESIRISTILLKPFLPDTSDKIFKQIGTNIIDYSTVDKFGYLDKITVGDAEPLFMRIDTKKE